MNKIKVGISFLNYPMSLAKYFVEAFEDRGDCEIFTVGPDFGSYIPWGGGQHLPMRYVKPMYVALPQYVGSQKVPYALVQNQMPDDLDLFLSIDAGFHFSTRPNAKVVALLETDPHCLLQSYQAPKAYSDLTFNMQSPYMQSGDYYLPYAYSKRHHYDEELEPIYDACLIGLHYKERNDLVGALLDKGYKVHYSIGEVFDKFRHIYNQSKIALSWSSQQDLCARNWEALAMNRLLVANHVPDMQTFFVDGEHYLGFSNLEEAVSKVQWAMENPVEAQAIADAGWRKVQPHTYDKRVQEILETCKII